MKTKAKAALISAAAIVGVAGGIWFSWCSGINYERRYKKLFDKTFKGDYKTTVTYTGLLIDDEAPLKLPVLYKEYDIEYKDKNGSERHLELSNGMGYLHSNSKDETVSEYIKNRNIKADRDLMTVFILQMHDIIRNDMIDNILPKYFDAEREKDHPFEVTGDGYSINISPFDFCAGYITDNYSNDDKITEYLSPENCPILSEADMDSAADIKTYVLRITVDINDESKYDMMDEYLEKAEELCNEYAAASDFGGNYVCKVRTLSGEDKGFEMIDQTAVYVINGEKVDFDPNDDDTDKKYKDMIAEKAGYNTSEE